MPDPLRILIADDEPPARDRLRRLLGAHGDSVGVIDEAEDGVEALEALQEREHDLVFLDVRMPGLDGFDVLDRLDPEHRPAVVFTTAYDEYALRAFEANAVDYLLKPIEPERLAESIRRVASSRPPGSDDRLARLLDYLDGDALPPEGAAAPPAPTEEPSPNAPEPLRQLTVPSRDRLLVISADDIVAAEVHDGITNLYARPQDTAEPTALARYIVSFTLDALEARLDDGEFMRVHRSALVRVDSIREMVSWFSGRYKLLLVGGHEVIASRARSRELRDRLAL